MSAPISPSLPSSDPNFADADFRFVEAFAFEGADELWRSWREGLTPDPLLTVSEWADRHRFLSPRASAEPGRYRTDRTPYMRAIMDALSPSHPVRRIVFMKAAQVGATEAGNNWIGYVIHHAPGPMLSVQPTVELAKRFSRQRIEPLIAESPSLRERVKPSRARDAGNTVLSKEFPAGLLVITGANSAVGLRSMPARYLFLDEVDAYPPSADEEGDPVALAEARTRTFSWRSKVFLASTPTIHGVSRIEREFEASDQQRFFVPCPHCQHRQWLRFERLRWDKGKPETAHYICDACDTPIEEHHKIAMLEDGEWRATAEATDPGTIGFHLSALYSPVGWMSWAMIARMWETSQSSDEAKRSFKNSVLGETWIETGDAPDWQRLYERREDWQIGTVPSGGLFLTAGADVQKDRIEVSIWAWGRDLTSWLVDHIVIDGGPDNPECWSELASLLERTWPHAHGARLSLAKLGIDTGYEASAVYSWARAMGHGQVAPLKGAEGFNRAAPVVGPSFVDVTEAGKRLRRGARLWTVAVATFKSETYRYLRLVRPTDEDILAGARYPGGYVHLPRGLEAEWVKQLVAEQLISVKTRRGFQKLEWQKLRERNEVLDCRVYARAAAWIAGADRWADEKWRDLEDQVGPMPEHLLDVKPDASIAAGVLARAPSMGGKRRSDWLSGVDKGWLR
ncbi:MAG: phage terminase large subunit family protein [Methylobacterium sp.]|nr:phage terminase large subunit family protein [Methylobacterium sp.]MCA3679776.1 phage terminase large subunit family protein [Methylobacterium sp.]MCA3704313.1 phage terminase large subunit family protein [Methylobacterium sp.]